MEDFNFRITAVSYQQFYFAVIIIFAHNSVVRTETVRPARTVSTTNLCIPINPVMIHPTNWMNHRWLLGATVS